MLSSVYTACRIADGAAVDAVSANSACKSGTLKNIIIHISSKQVAYDEAAADRAEREKEADDDDEDWGELFELMEGATNNALRRTTRLLAPDDEVNAAIDAALAE